MVNLTLTDLEEITKLIQTLEEVSSLFSFVEIAEVRLVKDTGTLIIRAGNEGFFLEVEE